MPATNITKNYYIIHKAKQKEVGQNYIYCTLTTKKSKTGKKIEYISSVIANSQLFPKSSRVIDFQPMDSNTYNKIQLGDEIYVSNAKVKIKKTNSTPEERLQNITKCLKVYINQIGTKEDLENFDKNNTEDPYSDIVLSYKDGKNKHYFRPLKNKEKDNEFISLFPKKDWEVRTIPNDIKRGLAYINKIWQDINYLTQAYADLCYVDNDKIYNFTRYIEDLDYSKPKNNPIIDILLNNNKNQSKNKLLKHLDQILTNPKVK